MIEIPLPDIKFTERKSAARRKDEASKKKNIRLL